MGKYLVIKEEGSTSKQSYVGVPYTNMHDAREAAINDFYLTHFVYNHQHKMEVYYFENETHLRFVSEETGEIFCDYFLLIVFF